MPWHRIRFTIRKSAKRTRFEGNVKNWIFSIERLEHILSGKSKIWKGPRRLDVEVDTTRSDALSPDHFNNYVKGDYEKIHFWARHHQNFDAVNLGCGAMEIPDYKQMAELKSELAKEGRGHCKAIESATGKPTYYNMMRYWGWKDKRKEANRACPCPDRGIPEKENTFLRRLST